MHHRTKSLFILITSTILLCLRFADADIYDTLNSSINETDSLTTGVNELQKMPELKTFVKAQYPDSLLTKNIEGTVTLELLVNDSGRVDSARILQSLHPALDSLACSAALNFIFTPGIAEDKPVPVYLTYNYNFSIDQLTDSIPEYVSIKGRVLEKGTRIPLSDVMVVISYQDSLLSNISDNTTSGSKNLPLHLYLKKIGTFKGQTLENNRLVTVSDSLGNFSFKSLPAELCSLRIIAPGFETYNEELDIKKNEVISLNCYAERTSYNEYEITVYGKQEKKEITSRSLLVTEAKRVPGFSGDPVKAVQALPGVTRSLFGSTEIILRGADWYDNKYYIDGIEIPFLWHEIGATCVLNPNLIDNVSLYTGGFSTRYGDALGGVIDITSKKARADRVHVIADFNLATASLNLEIPFTKKLSFTGAIRREYYMSLVNFLSKNFIDEDLGINLYYWDYSLRLDYQPKPDHNLFCEFISAKDTMYQTIQNDRVGVDDSYNFGKSFKTFVTGWDWNNSNGLKNTLRYGLAPKDEAYAFSESETSYKGSADGYEHTLRDEFTIHKFRLFKPSVGLDLHLEPFNLYIYNKGQYFPDNSYERRDTTFSDTINFTDGSVAGYISCEIQPLRNLTITPEYRLDYYPGLHYDGSFIPQFWNYKKGYDCNWSVEPSLRLLARYKINEFQTVKGFAGSFNKSPSMNADEKIGNTALEPARGAHYSIGYEWQLTDLISADIQGYINRQWDKALRVNGADYFNQTDNSKMENRGKARMQGLELFIRHNQSRNFFGWLSYSLAFSERYDYYEKKWIVFDRNILNNLQIVSSFNLKKNKNIGFRFQFTNGYPYTPAKRVLYYDSEQFEYVPEWGEKNSDLHDPYIGLDIRFEKKIAFRRNIMTFYVGCDRIIHFLQFIKDDNGNPIYNPAEMPMYNYDYSKQTGFANYPSPNFGMSLEF
ncbi:MAG: TonB-dependent receptor [Fibrobacter sp.]|nr:TonB-dependent receptor [Fibrobacter sp.]